MRNLVLTSCVALGLATAPIGASPAQALEGQEILGLLAGIAALAIIGNQVNKAPSSSSSQNPVRVHKPKKKRYGYHNGKPRYRKNVLPGACTVRLSTARGTQKYLGASCLRQNGVRLGNLPRSCLFTIESSRTKRSLFRSSCLRNAGFAIAGR